MAHSDEDTALAEYGYTQRLDRSIGKFASFCIGFSVISATTAVYSGFGYGLDKAGPAFVWTFPIGVAVLAVWALIAADLSSKMPLSGYAYQWTSRLVGAAWGWFTGYAGLIGFISGFTGVAYTLALYLSGLLGWELSPGQQLGLTAIVVLACVLINVYGVRFATLLNNLGVGLELIVTLGATAIVGIYVLVANSGQPLSFLTSDGGTPHSGYLAAWLTSSLGCVFGLLGVEASADVAEETRDARRIIPRTMFYALAASAIVEFVMYIVFLLSTKSATAVAASSSPIDEIMREQLSPAFAKVIITVALSNILVCVLANMLVATRLLYAMARDNMLPFSGLLSKVSTRHRTPFVAVWVTGAISGLFLLTSVLSPTAFAYILGMCTLGYFVVYSLTTLGLFSADLRKKFPATVPGTFDLGSFRRVVHVIGAVLFLAVVVALLVLPDFRANAAPFAALMVLAAIWWAVVLRRRVAAGTAGPHRVGTEATVPAQSEAD